MYRQSLLLFSLLTASMLVSLSATADSGHANDGREAAMLAPRVTISGTVTDAQTDEALPGVNVMVIGTTLGTATDVNGEYSLNVPAEADSLMFSYIGYETARVPIAGRTIIDVAMEPVIYVGEDVVVIGYGTTRKSDLTGSVASLNPEDFNQGVTTTVDELMNGKIAGVRVVQSTGEPGGAASVNIRGASSINAGTAPLYVVDGVPLDNAPAVAGSGRGFIGGERAGRSPLSSINPADIASIEVLKDASATAIYGARGANGVILITTKSGDQGRLKINYDGYVGTQRVINELDMLTPQEYQRVLNDIIDARIAEAETDDEIASLEELRVTEMAEGGTNWQEQVFAETPIVHSHNLSFSGGTDETDYYVSLNAFQQDGVVISSAFDRYAGRINLDHQITDQFDLALNLSTAYTQDDYVASGFGVNENAGALYSAYNFDPSLPVRDPSGGYTESGFLTIENPLVIANGRLSDAETYRTYGSVSGQYYLTPAWTAKLQLGMDVSNANRDTYITRLTQDGRAFGGIATVIKGRQTSFLVEATTTYDKMIGDDHHITALGGVTAQRFRTLRSNTSASGFPTDVLRTFNLGIADPTTLDANSSKFGYQLQSYIGRLNYSFRNKYLATATIRVDGSSRFGPENRYGVFPSGALAWKLGQEEFMDDLDFFSTLKLRASWGQTGNQAIGNYTYLTLFSNGPVVALGDQQVSTLAPGEMLPNPDLKWETTEQWDIGLDFGFLDDRVYGSIDYYQKDTYDMLLQQPVPPAAGYSWQWANVGSVLNSGFELELTSRNITGPGLTWDTNVSLATLDNEVQNLAETDTLIFGNAGFVNNIVINTPGQPLNSYFGYEVLGVWQEGEDFATYGAEPGDLRFRDVNDDGVINADDRVILGNSFPSLSWSMGNTFGHKGVQLYVFVQGVHGVDMLNNNLVDTYYPVQFRRNKFAEPYLNRWTPENPSDEYPSFVNDLQGETAVNSRTVRDASYIRLQTVRVSYRLPRWSGMWRNMTVYAAADNLLTITDYEGVDPAVNPNSDANFRIDYNAYPLARSYTLGVQVGL